LSLGAKNSTALLATINVNKLHHYAKDGKECIVWRNSELSLGKSAGRTGDFQSKDKTSGEPTKLSLIWEPSFLICRWPAGGSLVETSYIEERAARRHDRDDQLYNLTIARLAGTIPPHFPFLPWCGVSLQLPIAEALKMTRLQSVVVW